MQASEKRCTKCGAVRARSEFSAHKKARDGLQSNCKPCVAARAASYRQPKPCLRCGGPKGGRKSKKLCERCLNTCNSCNVKEREPGRRMCSDCTAEFDRKRKSSPVAKYKDKITRVASKYGVSRAYAAVLAAMRTCAACGKTCERPGELHVDHCHASGRVRGVLCFNCNAALGNVGDSTERLRALISYMETAKQEEKEGKTDFEKAAEYMDLLIELESQPNSVS